MTLLDFFKKHLQIYIFIVHYAAISEIFTDQISIDDFLPLFLLNNAINISYSPETIPQIRFHVVNMQL